MAERTKKELIEHSDWQALRISQVEKQRDRQLMINDDYVKRIQYFSGRRFLIVDWCIITQTVIYIVGLSWVIAKFG